MSKIIRQGSSSPRQTNNFSQKCHIKRKYLKRLLQNNNQPNINSKIINQRNIRQDHF